jgi:hypothetical protein
LRKAADAHQACLQRLHRVQAGQQGRPAAAQLAFKGVQGQAGRVDGLEFGFPSRLVGEQVAQVPGGLDWNIGSCQALLHGVGSLPDSWMHGESAARCAGPSTGAVLSATTAGGGAKV